MLKQIPVKKAYLLIAATILLLLLGYQLAFKETVKSWRLHQQLQAQLGQAADLSYQPAYVERKNNNLTNILERYKIDTVAFRNNNISNISIIAVKENIKLSEVPVQDPFLNTNRFIVQKLIFEGSFFEITKVLNQLQATNKIGMIRSVTYKVIRLPSVDNIKKLQMEVYFEYIK